MRQRRSYDLPTREKMMRELLCVFFFCLQPAGHTASLQVRSEAPKISTLCLGRPRVMAATDIHLHLSCTNNIWVLPASSPKRADKQKREEKIMKHAKTPGGTHLFVTHNFLGTSVVRGRFGEEKRLLIRGRERGRDRIVGGRGGSGTGSTYGMWSGTCRRESARFRLALIVCAIVIKGCEMGKDAVHTTVKVVRKSKCNGESKELCRYFDNNLHKKNDLVGSWG